MLESLFNKNAGLKACNFIKKTLQHRCFPVKFAKFLKRPFFAEHIRWLLLEISHELSLIAFENNKWCHFVVSTGSPAFISFYYYRKLLFISFLSISFFFSNFFVNSTTFWFEVSLSILKTKQGSCS